MAGTVNPGFLRRHPVLTVLISLLAAALIAAVGWNIYQKQAIREEKAKFAQAEQDIDQLSAEIIAATGQPLKVEKKKFCSRPNMKFQEGPLSCHIDIDSFYKVNVPEEANTLLRTHGTSAGKIWTLTGQNSSNNLGNGTQFTSLNLENYQYRKDNQQIFENIITRELVSPAELHTTYTKHLSHRITSLLAQAKHN